MMRLRWEHFINQLKLILWLIFLWGCAVSGITIMLGLYSPPAQSPFAIITNTLKLTETWRVSNLIIRSNALARYTSIGVTSHCIVAVLWGNSLVCLSLENGMVKWQTSVDSSGVLAYDINKVYIGAANDYIRAYNLETGNIVWKSRVYLPDRSSNFLKLQSERLFNHVLKDGNEYVYQFSPDTGELLTQETNPISDYDFPRFIMRLGNIDLRQNPAYLFKVNHQTGIVIWQTELNNPPDDNKIPYTRVKYFPILAHNNLVMLVNHALVVIDFTTGQYLWVNKGPFVSNVALVQDKIYVLREDMRLVALEATTGHELGYIQFTQPKQAENTGSYPVFTYWVGTDEQGRVFVYFSDSEELIGLAPR